MGPGGCCTRRLHDYGMSPEVLPRTGWLCVYAPLHMLEVGLTTPWLLFLRWLVLCANCLPAVVVVVVVVQGLSEKVVLEMARQAEVDIEVCRCGAKGCRRFL